MRFLADGPDIPFNLLEARDAGQVIFLCGAGLSIPAGLPSFWGLTRSVIEDLGVPANDRGRSMVAAALDKNDPSFAPPLDQVFGVLARDYGVRQVEASVAKGLKGARRPDIARHDTVLRLSTDPQGRRRVITTNFDRLFEVADRKLAHVVPPALPDLDYTPALEGAVYLHGRLPPAGAQGPMGLVLGSSDFGRAYLAEGWATRFIRQVLDRYTLVLLGYSAEDPPVRYLLEGLHAAGSERPATLYAFSEGEQGDAETRWRERGVRPITYRATDRSHSALWRSLEAWAQQVDDPVAWRTSITRMAARGPENLAPHERGQVAALVTSVQGARAFAEAEPSPPADWLCVFDPAIRLGKPYQSFLERDAEPRVPRDVYGLDGDPALEDDEGPRLDPLRPVGHEQTSAPFSGLTLFSARKPPPLPGRLFLLSAWLSKVALQPAALWWAAGQSALHPSVSDLVDRQLGFQPAAEHQDPIIAWRLLFEAHRDPPSEYRGEWYDLKGKVEKTGWTPGLLRALSMVLRPRLKAQRPPYRAPFPPDSFEAMQSIIDFDVDFLQLTSDELAFEPAMLAPIVATWRQALIVGADLLTEVTPADWSTLTLVPEQGVGEHYVDDKDSFYLSFANLFERLAAHDLPRARAELAAWPEDDPFFFNKLRIWAWRRADLADPVTVASGLLTLSEDGFWGDRRDRELLFTLRARWAEFDEATRTKLEARLLAGPAQDEGESLEDYTPRRAVASATRLGWLKLQDCPLLADTEAALPALRATHPRWTLTWDEHAADSWDGRTYSVREDPDPEPLLQAPLAELANLAQTAERRDEHGPRRAVPFVGLVKSNPAKALAVLAFEHRADRHPQKLWSQLLSADQVPFSPRLRRLVAERLCRLPDAVLAALRFEVARWFSGQALALAKPDPDLAWRLWDRHFDVLVAGGDAALRSGIGTAKVGGVTQLRSRRTIEHAINGPVGVLTQALLRILEAREPRANAGLPDDIKLRLERALAAPGEGGDHAAAIIARAMVWLDRLAPDFVAARIMPTMDPALERSEAAWSGYLAGGHLLAPKRFALIKPSFLALFSAAGGWTWSKPALARMADFLVVMSFEKSNRFVTSAEARRALQSGGPEALSGAAASLFRRLSAKQDWPAVKRFLTTIWPKELRFASAELSKRLADLAPRAGEAFPDAVTTILPLLQPFDQVDMFVYRVGRREDEDDLPPVERFPHACLRLLDAVIAPSPPSPPYDLARALELIAKAAPDLRATNAWRRLSALTV